MGAWVSSVGLAGSPKASPRGPAMPSHAQCCWQGEHSIPCILGLRAHLSTSRESADLAKPLSLIELTPQATGHRH